MTEPLEAPLLELRRLAVSFATARLCRIWICERITVLARAAAALPGVAVAPVSGERSVIRMTAPALVSATSEIERA